MNFDLQPGEQPPRRQNFLTLFLADCMSRTIGTFLGVLLAGLILLASLRVYVGWEAGRIADKISDRMEQKVTPKK